MPDGSKLTAARELARSAMLVAEAASAALVQEEEERVTQRGRWRPSHPRSHDSSSYWRGELPDVHVNANFPLREQAEAIFMSADKDCDGRLNMKQLRDAMTQPELAEMAIACHMLGSNDESVTLQEFLLEVKKAYNINSQAAEHMLFAYEDVLKQRRVWGFVSSEQKSLETASDSSCSSINTVWSFTKTDQPRRRPLSLWIWNVL